MEIIEKSASATKFVWLDKSDIVVSFKDDDKIFMRLKTILGTHKLRRLQKDTIRIDFHARYVLPLFSGLSLENFTFSQDFLDIKNKVQYIKDNEEKFVPTVTIENSNLIFSNVANNTKNLVTEIFHNFYQKSPQIFAERLRRLYVNFDYDFTVDDQDLNLSKKILSSKYSSFSISPKTHNFEKLWKNIEFLGQKPVVIVLDESNCVVDKIEKIIPAILTTVDKKNISFMFRLDNKSHENIQFNQYLHKNGLDAPVNNNTEVVFIARNKITKIFLKHFSSPYSLILMTAHSFGKLKYLVQNSQVTYLYQDSIFNVTGDKIEIM